mmetsp:Transcript_20480/g.47395  ORF Transcript_20480/g.47395 Transcript_20480/m.47395 type:complete len:239 (-) Transcript_20480:470-1186(-)
MKLLRACVACMMLSCTGAFQSPRGMSSQRIAPWVLRAFPSRYLTKGGKSFEKCGEKFVQFAEEFEGEGQAFAQVGALLRNAGGHLAQAAANIGSESGKPMAIAELRQSASCFDEAREILKESDYKKDRYKPLPYLIKTELPVPLDRLMKSIQDAAECLEAGGPREDMSRAFGNVSEGVHCLSAAMCTLDRNEFHLVESGKHVALAAQSLRDLTSDLMDQEHKGPLASRALNKRGTFRL